MLITEEFEWNYHTFEAHIEGMCPQIAAYPSNRINFFAPLSPLTILTLFATWKVGKIACPLNPKIPSPPLPLFTPSWPTPLSPTPTTWDLDQEATFLFTSGSSGNPKIACHTLRNLLLNAEGSFLKIPLEEKSCWSLVLPLFHVGGLGILFRCYLKRAKVLLSHDWSRATHLSLVPTQLYRLLHTCPKLPYLECILLGGAPIPSLQAPWNIFPTYGMTEMSSQIVTDHSLHPYAEMTFSKEGEIWVRGGTLFQGYLNGDSLYLPLNSEGWFETGDIGGWKENRFEITGRKDNLFISGGENIQPEEVEAALKAICNIEEAIVIPLPDTEFGARPAVFLQDPSLLPFIQTKLQDVLPKFKIPIRAFQLPEINTLKPNRKKLIVLAETLVSC